MREGLRKCEGGVGWGEGVHMCRYKTCRLSSFTVSPFFLRPSPSFSSFHLSPSSLLLFSPSHPPPSLPPSVNDGITELRQLRTLILNDCQIEELPPNLGK